MEIFIHEKLKKKWRTVNNIFQDHGNTEENFWGQGNSAKMNFWEQGNSAKMNFWEHLNLFMGNKGDLNWPLQKLRED